MVKKVLSAMVGAVAVMVIGIGCPGPTNTPPAVFKVLTPAAGAIYKVGDTIQVTWDEPASTTKINVWISINDGIDYSSALVGSSVQSGVKHFGYKIPSTLLTAASTLCKIKVSEYTDDTKNAESGDFTINP
jgi:hypothetical protein